MPPELIQAFAQWPIVGVVIWFAVRAVQAERSRSEKKESELEAKLVKKEADCAAERLESAKKHEELQREMLGREIQVRDRERTDTMRVMGEMTGVVAGHTRSIVDLTQELKSRKSMQKIQAVTGGE